MQESDFLQSLMVLPIKPEFIGFTISTDTLYKQLVPIMNQIIGHDVSDLCEWSCNDEDNEFYFNLNCDDLYNFLDNEEEYHRIWDKLPFDLDSPWEVAQHLLSELYQVHSTWAYASVRGYDTSVTEVQIGIPRNL